MRLFPDRDVRRASARRACLAFRASSCQRTVFPRTSGTIMSASWDEARTKGRFARKGSGSPLWHFLRGFIKHPVMVGSIIPSSKAMIDKMLAPVDWANCKLFVEYGPGVGTFTEHVLRRMAPDATLIAIDTNPDFVRYLRGKFTDSRLFAGHRIGGGRPPDHRRLRLRACRLHPLRPALLDPAGRRRPEDRRGDRRGAPPRRRLPRLSVQAPRVARFHGRPISSGSTAASNGSTSRPATCSGAGRTSQAA